ncbi:MAG: DNA-binding protein Alba [Methanomicrobiales archaeon]|nr:DNA-binding protein Alba [Methanomicrobiales archaeon]
MMKDNTVFVGSKPVMNYVLAVVTQFNNGAPEVAIKARGKAISRAVDTAEIALNRFLDGVTKKHIVTSTEVIDTDSGKTNVSSIEIVLENTRPGTSTVRNFPVKEQPQ